MNSKLGKFKNLTLVEIGLDSFVKLGVENKVNSLISPQTS